MDNKHVVDDNESLTRLGYILKLGSSIKHDKRDRHRHINIPESAYSPQV